MNEQLAAVVRRMAEEEAHDEDDGGAGMAAMEAEWKTQAERNRQTIDAQMAAVEAAATAEKKVCFFVCR